MRVAAGHRARTRTVRRGSLRSSVTCPSRGRLPRHHRRASPERTGVNRDPRVVLVQTASRSDPAAPDARCVLTTDIRHEPHAANARRGRPSQPASDLGAAGRESRADRRFVGLDPPPVGPRVREDEEPPDHRRVPAAVAGDARSEPSLAIDADEHRLHVGRDRLRPRRRPAPMDRMEREDVDRAALTAPGEGDLDGDDPAERLQMAHDTLDEPCMGLVQEPVESLAAPSQGQIGRGTERGRGTIQGIERQAGALAALDPADLRSREVGRVREIRLPPSPPHAQRPDATPEPPEVHRRSMARATHPRLIGRSPPRRAGTIASGAPQSANPRATCRATHLRRRRRDVLRPRLPAAHPAHRRRSARRPGDRAGRGRRQPLRRVPRPRGRAHGRRDRHPPRRPRPPRLLPRPRPPLRRARDRRDRDRLLRAHRRHRGPGHLVRLPGAPGEGHVRGVACRHRRRGRPPARRDRRRPPVHDRVLHGRPPRIRHHDDGPRPGGRRSGSTGGPWGRRATGRPRRRTSRRP